VVRLGRAWTTFRGKRLGIEAATVDPDRSGPAGELHGTTVTTPEGGLRLVTVKPEGRQAVAADQWINGARPVEGERVG
jgi:methionyl-tRNA formyltransferase